MAKNAHNPLARFVKVCMNIKFILNVKFCKFMKCVKYKKASKSVAQPFLYILLCFFDASTCKPAVSNRTTDLRTHNNVIYMRQSNDVGEMNRKTVRDQHKSFPQVMINTSKTISPDTQDHASGTSKKCRIIGKTKTFCSHEIHNS